MIHELKLFEKRCDAVVAGSCRFDIRFDDNRYAVGDYIEYTAVDRHGSTVSHEIADFRYQIKYIAKDIPGLEDGYIALGF